ncbi:hypothetical protein T459_20730 [Capsicum annuum]|uniref:Protein kinase domain-containing protein n=1 Tax=Capsicum annuum TaxID=4072 RepID=A0A2G2Z5B5_CAPAN|nr:hypothetical protein T459_20730 [Capsicum annuum]
MLLDEQNNPKIADVGLPRLMTTVGNTNVIATAGYRAPELSKIKNASTKTDVYSLGVIILELLTENPLARLWMCVDPTPTVRPEAPQVLQKLEEIKPYLMLD